MDIEKHVEGLAEVRFVGGFLHGARAYMANPTFRLPMESPAGEWVCYCRRIIESLNANGEDLTVVSYAPEGLPDHEFTRLVLDAARNGTYKTSLD